MLTPDPTAAGKAATVLVVAIALLGLALWEAKRDRRRYARMRDTAERNGRIATGREEVRDAE